MGRLRPGTGLRRRWAVGWASDEVGSWACPVGRWNPHHDAGATGVSVADGEGSLECAADADPDDRRNGRGGDRRQRVRLAAVCPVVAFLASSSGVGLNSFLATLWPPCRSKQKRAASHRLEGDTSSPMARVMPFTFRFQTRANAPARSRSWAQSPDRSSARVNGHSCAKRHAPALPLAQLDHS